MHRDAGGENGHDREGERVKGARLFVEAQLEIFRHRAGFRAVIEGHHEDADEHHRRDRAHPIKMAGHDPIFRARSGHADDFLRPEISGDESQTSNPGGDGAAREKEIAARFDIAPQRPPDAQHESEIDGKD